MTSTRDQYERWHRKMGSVEESTGVVTYPWHRTVLRLLPDLGGRRVLEIGCGRGDFACALAKIYPQARITGVDFSEAAIAQAQIKASLVENATFQVADAENLPFADEAFDYIISCECLEHLEQPGRAVASMARCLGRNGEFILTTENYCNGMVLMWLKCWMEGKSFDSGSGIQPRENFFLFWRVRRFFHRAGLTITHEESNHFVWLLLPRMAPDTFFTKDFRRDWLKQAFRPFGRHYTYCGRK